MPAETELRNSASPRLSGVVKAARPSTLIPIAESAPLVALVDGQIRRRKLQERFLSKAGFRPHSLALGADLLALLLIAPPDVVLLDSGVADVDPVELCRSLRLRRFFGPVVVLATQADAELEIGVLKAGANDFLLHTSPEAVLEARLNAHLAAVRGYAAVHEALLDRNALERLRRSLSDREFPLVARLNERAPSAVGHDELCTCSERYRPTLGALSKHMSRIRRKLAPRGLDIKATPGAYRLVRIRTE